MYEWMYVWANKHFHIECIVYIVTGQIPNWSKQKFCSRGRILWVFPVFIFSKTYIPFNSSASSLLSTWSGVDSPHEVISLVSLPLCWLWWGDSDMVLLWRSCRITSASSVNCNSLLLSQCSRKSCCWSPLLTGVSGMSSNKVTKVSLTNPPKSMFQRCQNIEVNSKEETTIWTDTRVGSLISYFACTTQPYTHIRSSHGEVTN